MGIADDARRMVNDESSRKRNEEAARDRTRSLVEDQIKAIILRSVPDFVAAAKPKSGLFTRSWSFPVDYSTSWSGDGYRGVSTARVIITRGGRCEVTAKSAGYGASTVSEDLIKNSVTKALADILRGTK